jgi:hypothetical protein
MTVYTGTSGADSLSGTGSGDTHYGLDGNGFLYDIYGVTLLMRAVALTTSMFTTTAIIPFMEGLTMTIYR